jgi:hypothetical protein
MKWKQSSSHTNEGKENLAQAGSSRNTIHYANPFHLILRTSR